MLEGWEKQPMSLRVLRAFLGVIQATLRTNFYQRDESGADKTYVSIKLNPKKVPDLPAPRPQFEIFVYSPRVEGVHLRFGAVARGGLRWSDRRDDFRTEVLGLVKAQMVKNTVIVPVGAKGGFFCKQLPDSSDRDAWMAEGIADAHTMVDFGDDALTAGRAHPMIDPTLRLEHLARVAADDTTAVVLMDVVLGHGSEPDPAAALALAIADVRQPVVVAVVGTVAAASFACSLQGTGAYLLDGIVELAALGRDASHAPHVVRLHIFFERQRPAGGLRWY